MLDDIGTDGDDVLIAKSVHVLIWAQLFSFPDQIVKCKYFPLADLNL